MKLIWCSFEVKVSGEKKGKVTVAQRQGSDFN